MMSEFSRIIDIDQESYIRMKEIIKIIYMGKSIIIVFLYYENNTTTQ
jgi:hypothetical protein